jgi:hypothetical protein
MGCLLDHEKQATMSMMDGTENGADGREATSGALAASELSLERRRVTFP